MKENPGLRFLYHTVCGRILLKLVVRPGLSEAVGRFMDSPASKPLITRFMKKNRISLDGISLPPEGFSSFNDFFTRKRKNVVFDPEPNHLCSPCDGLLSGFMVDENSRFCIKGTEYSLGELLNDRRMAESFIGGTALLFRLTPAHYHRYCFVDDGVITEQKSIKGVLHCVRPIATEKFPVYIQNSRQWCLISSEHFGRFLQMEIGALMVGKIKNHPTDTAKRGAEKGYFAFGGSSILMLFEKDSVSLKPGVFEQEREVTMGEWI